MEVTNQSDTSALSYQRQAQQLVLNFIQLKMEQNRYQKYEAPADAMIDQPHKKLTKVNLAHDYDKSFRRMVIDSMLYLGIDQHTTETVLEQCAGIWQRQMMLETFEQFYYPKHEEPITNDDWKNWMLLKSEHQTLWLQRREYDYYQEHHAIIDETGTASEHMLITPAQANRLTEEILHYEQLNQEMRAKLRQTRPAALGLAANQAHTTHDQNRTL